MHLTDREYQIFKTHFHCTAASDEGYCVPIEVETPDGTATWTAYVSGLQFHAAVDWIKRSRCPSTPEDGAASHEPVVVPQPVRIPARLGWPRQLALQVRAAFGKGATPAR